MLIVVFDDTDVQHYLRHFIDYSRSQMISWHTQLPSYFAQLELGLIGELVHLFLLQSAGKCALVLSQCTIDLFCVACSIVCTFTCSLTCIACS